MSQRIMSTPCGKLLLRAEGGCLREIRRVDEAHEICACGADVVLDEAQRQLTAYFTGERSSFSLPLLPEGTVFERAVWQQLMQIPYGSVMTYSDLAAAMGMPKGARAVGGACARNPLLIVVPCHRVIAGTGKLTGFAGGLDMKRMLLEREGWTICGEYVKK